MILMDTINKNNSALDQITVLIPAAGNVSEQLSPLIQRSSSAMMPLNGKPVIFWTLDYLRQQGFRQIKIAVRDQDSIVKRFVETIFQDSMDLEFIVPDRDRGVGYTVLRLAEKVNTSKTLIVLGDTFFQFPNPELAFVDNSFLLVSPVEEYSRWCLAERDENQRAKRFIDKPEEYHGQGEALIGVYAFHNIGAFQKSLRTVWAEKSAAGERFELSSALELYNQSNPMLCITCQEWFDCGHLDNLIKSKRKMLQVRNFNEITFNEELGTITKKSEYLNKFVNEIQYYSLIPESLRVLFPRIVRSNCHGSEPFIEMEYYGYPTLTELFVFEYLDPNLWQKIFRHLFAILKLMKQYRRPADCWSYKNMYVQRIEERTRRLAESSTQLASILYGDRTIKINEINCRRFSSLWPEAKLRFQQMMTEDDFSVIHGDMCFSNVLYDLNSDLCKFIDPRGSFGHPGVYGDPRYDVAKLYHSAHGLYDFIINDLFSVQGSDDEFQFTIFTDKHSDIVCDALFGVFEEEFKRNEILLIEGMLFLTMGVFHTDKPERQKAMLLRGLQIWNDIFE